MNSWFLLALLAPAIYTFVIFIDKYVLESKVKDYRGMPIYGSIVAAATGTLIWLFTGFPTLPLFDGSIVIITGILTLFSYAIYFNALSKSESSYIIGLFQMVPVLTLILSFLFLREVISPKQLLGFTLVLSPVLAMSVKKEKKKFKLDEAFFLILVSDLLFAISAVLIKFALSANSFTNIFIYESWGITIGGIILFTSFPSVKKAFLKTTRKVGGKVLGIMFLNEFIFIFSKVITFLAISLGPVALVSVLGGTQVFYGILYGFILTLIAPKIFKEEIDRESIVKKLILMGILFAGLWLLY